MKLLKRVIRNRLFCGTIAGVVKIMKFLLTLNYGAISKLRIVGLSKMLSISMY